MRGSHFIAALTLAVVGCGDRTGLEDDRAAAGDASFGDAACNPIPEGCRADRMLACQTGQEHVLALQVRGLQSLLARERMRSRPRAGSSFFKRAAQRLTVGHARGPAGQEIIEGVA
jgi:hypothetical protein